jgi:two-component system invasion response regulator UvrY
VSPSSEKIRVLIADDHAVVRIGLRRLIEESDDIVVAGEAGSGHEAVTLSRESTIDVVLLDVSMPDCNVVETLDRIKRNRPGMPVLIISMYPEEQYAVNLLRAGASGYLSKSAEPETLVGAIRTVARGSRYISATLAEMLALGASGEECEPLHRQLSKREFQIFCRIAAGASVSQIAEELNLSIKTVSTYRARVLEKMNMKSNVDLTYYAMKNQLLP